MSAVKGRVSVSAWLSNTVTFEVTVCLLCFKPKHSNITRAGVKGNVGLRGLLSQHSESLVLLFVISDGAQLVLSSGRQTH